MQVCCGSACSAACLCLEHTARLLFVVQTMEARTGARDQVEDKAAGSVEGSVKDKVGETADLFHHLRSRDASFLATATARSAENFPVPTYLNPSAVFAKNGDSSEAERQLAEKRLASVNRQLAGAGDSSHTDLLVSENPKKRKLLEIRQRLLQVRKQNEESVLAEQALIAQQNSKGFLKRHFKAQAEAREKEELGKLAYAGVDVTAEQDRKYLRLLKTVEQASKEKAKKAKSMENEERSANRGGLFNTDAAYLAYRRRVNKLSSSKAVSNGAKDQKHQAQRAKSKPGESSKSLVEMMLTFGKTDADVEDTDPEKVETLVRELEATEQRREQMREKSKKRKAKADGGDVSGINRNNDKWNDRLRRAFDEYTAETKQNLERGTAL